MRIASTHTFSSWSHGSSTSTSNGSSEFTNVIPGSLVIKMEIFLKSPGCSPQLKTLGVGMPAARAICIAATSPRLVRFVHFSTRPKGNWKICGSESILNQEQYNPEKWPRALWMNPQNRLVVLLGTYGTGGVVCDGKVTAGAGQVYWGRRMAGRKEVPTGMSVPGL